MTKGKQKNSIIIRNKLSVLFLHDFKKDFLWADYEVQIKTATIELKALIISDSAVLKLVYFRTLEILRFPRQPMIPKYSQP